MHADVNDFPDKYEGKSWTPLGPSWIRNGLNSRRNKSLSKREYISLGHCFPHHPLHSHDYVQEPFFCNPLRYYIFVQSTHDTLASRLLASLVSAKRFAVMIAEFQCYCFQHMWAGSRKTMSRKYTLRAHETITKCLFY